MTIAELPRSIYELDSVRVTADAFRAFCTCEIAADDDVLRLAIAPLPGIDDVELGRSFLNYALTASMEARLC